MSFSERITADWPLGIDRAGRSNRLEFALIAVGAVICLTALWGWFTGDTLLARALSGLPTMKANTAFGMLLLLVATGCARHGACGLARLCATAALLMAVLSLGQTASGIDLGIDEWLVVDPETAEAAAPGRMAPMTAIAMGLLALALCASRGESARVRAGGRWATYGVLTVAYLASLAFLVDVRWTGGLAALMGSLSLPTATIILILGTLVVRLGDAAGTPSHGVDMPDTAGSRFAHVSLPAALLMPMVVAWGRELLVGRGWVSDHEGDVLAMAALGILFSMLVLGAARWISSLEASLRRHHANLEHIVLERTQHLLQAERRADQARERLSSLVDQVDVGVVTVDVRTHCIVLFNGAAERMFGRRAESMLGQPLSSLLPASVHGDHDHWMAAFATGTVTTRRMGGPESHVMGLRADGQAFMMEAKISRSHGGGDTLLTAVLRDLTVPLALEAERQARVAAEAASAAKSQQIGIVSHELKTPLNAVLGFSELMLVQPQAALGERLRNYATQIRNAGQHMLRLISDLSEISHIESGLAHLSLAPVEVTPMLQAVVAMVASTAEQAQVRVSIAAGADGVVTADPQRLQQVLLNLVSNAIKYNRPGGSVHLDAHTDPAAPGQCVVWVQDDGLGMSEAQRARLFEPFNRLGRERSGIEGTGLGLALSRSLVGAMNGRISVRSEAGRGSAFGVHLPTAEREHERDS